MITFEILEQLSRNCIQLVSSAVRLESTQSDSDKTITNATKEIIGSLRKIVIANELYEKQIICISGLQGAGKTTLIKNLYGLNDNILNVSLGRGEKIPVLIYESACKQPEMYVKELIQDAQTKQSQLVRHQVSKEEFVSYSDGSHQNIMYLELCLPYLHIRNNHTAFLLLPGYERRTDYWQNLIEFSSHCSDAAVFVFSEANFSRADNEKLLEQIRNRFHNNIIYVISHSDTSQDDNASVKQTCIEVMQVPAGQEDRVICAGSYAENDKNWAWIQQFVNAVPKYCQKSEAAEQCSAKYINAEIEKIINQIGCIRNVLNSGELDTIMVEFKQNSQNAGWLEAFDTVVEKKREIYSKQLKHALDEAQAQSKSKMDKIFEDKEYSKSLGLKIGTFGRDLKRALFGTKPKYIIEAANAVRIALYNENHIPYAYQKFVTAIDSTMAQIEEKSIAKRLIMNQSDEDIDAVTFDEDQQHTQNVPDKLAYSKSLAEIQNDFQLLFADGEREMKHDPKELLQMTAEIGAYCFAVNTVVECSSIQGMNIELSKSNLSAEKVLDGAKSTKTFGAGMLGLAGIDFAADGTLNMVPALAKAVGISSAGAAVGVAAVLAIGAAAAVTKDINRMKCDDYRSCITALESVYSNMEEEYLALFDEYMNSIRVKLEANLLKRSRINQNAMLVYNAQTALNHTEDALLELHKKTLEQNYGLQSYFR